MPRVGVYLFFHFYPILPTSGLRADYNKKKHDHHKIVDRVDRESQKGGGQWSIKGRGYGW